jgi:hypothetical protein
VAKSATNPAESRAACRVYRLRKRALNWGAVLKKDALRPTTGSMTKRCRMSNGDVGKTMTGRRLTTIRARKQPVVAGAP